MDEKLFKYLEVSQDLETNQCILREVDARCRKLEAQLDRIRDDLKSVLSDHVPRRAYKVGNKVVVVAWRGTDLPQVKVMDLEEVTDV